MFTYNPAQPRVPAGSPGGGEFGEGGGGSEGGASQGFKDRVKSETAGINPSLTKAAGSEVAIAKAGESKFTQAYFDSTANKITVFEDAMKDAAPGQVGHVIAHELSHKLDNDHYLTGGDQKFSQAFEKDRGKLSAERQAHWGYVASEGRNGEREVFAEAVALKSHPSPTTSWGRPSADFEKDFPNSIARARKLAAGVGVK